MLKFLFFLATFKREVQRPRWRKKKKKKPPYITFLPTTLIKIYKFNFQTCLPRLLVETQTWVKKHDDVHEEKKKRREDDREKERKKRQEEEEEGGGDRPKKLNVYR
jgi:hypothetical protein